MPVFFVLQVFDGPDSAATQLRKWWGYSSPLVVTSSGSNLHISFHSDDFTRGNNTIRLFTSVIYEWAKEAGVFVPDKPFQLVVVYAGVA